MKETSNLNCLFNPKTVALIGATDRAGSVGLGLSRNLLKGGDRRKIFFINPNKKKVLGRLTLPSLDVVNKKIDLAIIAVPAVAVRKVVQDCIRAMVGGTVIISSGFAEVGQEGKRLQKEIATMFKQAAIPMLGPNCLGIIRPSIKLNASFAPLIPSTGPIAFLSQSGALIDSVIASSSGSRLGFSVLISYGNEVDLDISDLLNFLAQDDKTKVIALYVEGITNGRRFLEVASRVSKRKPIVVLKGGKTKAGKKAVSSHTASLAGNAEVYSAGFKKAGVLEVETLRELLVVSSALALSQRFKGGLGVITNGGAMGVLVADWCSYYGISLPTLSSETNKKLKRFLPDRFISSLGNPLDILGDALSDRYEKAIVSMMEQKNIGAVLVIQTPQIMTDIRKNSRVLVKIKNRYPKKPILNLFWGAEDKKLATGFLTKNSILSFEEPKEAILAFRALFKGKSVN